MRQSLSILLIAVFSLLASGAEQFVTFVPGDSGISVVTGGKPLPVYVDRGADEAVAIAARSLAADFGRVTGTDAAIMPSPAGQCIIVGTVGTPIIDRLIKEKRIDGNC